MTEHITVSRELLRQALDFVDHMQYPQRLKDALRAALEQPAVEPYGWHVTGSNELLRGEYAQSDAESDAERCGGTAVALYTAPQQPADVPLLTKTEIVKCAFSPGGNEWLLGFARAIEQLVRQKAGLK